MRKVKRFLYRHKVLLTVVCIMFVFPLVVGGIYAIPCRQIIAIDSGDLLGYYATVFGILGSFITYRHEIRENRKEREKDLKPIFLVEVDRIENENYVFKVDITNYTTQTLSFFQLYDEFVSTIVQNKYSFKITYNKTIEETNLINPDYNITTDPEIMDSTGYPKYIQIICNDKDGNTWSCCYYKINDCNRIYYYPRDFEVL